MPVADGAPACRDADWIGFNAQKGLGIFTFGDLTLRRHPSYAESFSLYLPVEIGGPCRFNLLGVWVADARKIPPGATNDPLARHRLLPAFPGRRARGRCGRFQPPAPADVGAIKGITRRVRRRDAGGRRTGQRRHCHERRFRSGRAAPHALSPAPLQPRLRGGLSLHPGRGATRLTAFEVGDPHDWLRWSDHVPLVAEFDLTSESQFIQSNH